MDSSSKTTWWDQEHLLQSISGLTKSPITLVVLLPILTFVFSYLAAWTVSPLKKFPGPSLACKSPPMTTRRLGP